MATYIVTPSVGIVAGGLILDAIRNEVVGVVGLRLTWRDDRPGYDLGVEVDLDWTDRRTAEATVAGVMGRFDRGEWMGRWSDRGHDRPGDHPASHIIRWFEARVPCYADAGREAEPLQVRICGP